MKGESYEHRQKRLTLFSDFLFTKIGYISQNTIADAIGVKQSNIYAWTNGRYQPQPDNLGKLASFLELNEAETYYLFTLTNTALIDISGVHLVKTAATFYRSNPVNDYDASPESIPDDELLSDFLRAVRTFGMSTESPVEAK